MERSYPMEAPRTGGRIAPISIRTQAILLVAAGLVLLAVVVGLQLQAAQAGAAAARRVGTGSALVEARQASRVALTDQKAALLAFAENGRPDALGAFLARTPEVTLTAQRLTALAEAGGRPSARFQQLQFARAQWEQFSDQWLRAAPDSRPPAAVFAVDADYRFGLFTDADDAYAAALQADLLREVTGTQAVAARSSSITIAGSLLLAATLVGLGGIFVVRIAGPLHRLARAAHDLGAGAHPDLPFTDQGDEVGQLAGALAEWRQSELARLAGVEQLQLLVRQLNEASRLKSDFLATMSHELRTPLSAIISFAEILLEGIDGDLNAEQEEDVSEIRRSARSLLELINEILDLSKIEAGRMTLEAAPVAVAAVSARVVQAMRPLAEAKGLRLRQEGPEGLTAVGDDMRIGQVLTNLVSNAIKFTDSGEVSISWRDLGDQALISVTDTGIGIEPDARSLIFEEFRQAESGTARRFGGTGLGLAISKRLTELQGGSIGVDAAPEPAAEEGGPGSRFWFTIPCRPGPDRQTPDAPEA